MKIIKSIGYFFIVLLLFEGCLFTSCTSDEAITQMPVTDTEVAVAREYLQDTIVFHARSMQGTVNKTVFKGGCPLRYRFKWLDDRTMQMNIDSFTVGRMPVVIWFSINAQFMQLNKWEKDEYPGEGWIKFQGTRGSTSYLPSDAGKPGDEDENTGSGGAGTVQGYFNTKTHEIEFSTVFNVMNMTSDVFPQILDKEKNKEALKNFNADFQKYQEALEWYHQHGDNPNDLPPGYELDDK